MIIDTPVRRQVIFPEPRIVKLRVRFVALFPIQLEVQVVLQQSRLGEGIIPAPVAVNPRPQKRQGQQIQMPRIASYLENFRMGFSFFAPRPLPRQKSIAAALDIAAVSMP